MPRFDKTGPQGKGSKTGRGLGGCKEKKNNVKNGSWLDRFTRRRPGRRSGIWNRGEKQV